MKPGIREPASFPGWPGALLALLLSPPAMAAKFVYDGRLDDRGQPANGQFDLRLGAYAHHKDGVSLAAPIEFSAVEVVDGHFRLEFDLPLAFDDQAWIEVALRESGIAGAYSAIPGRNKALATPLIGQCWSSTGDSGSNPATNFLGTTDAQPLVLRTANVPSLRVEPSSVLFNGVPITTNLIAGSSANGVTAGVRGAVIAGGGVPAGNSDPDEFDEAPNRVTDHYGTVGGGYGNRAGNDAGSTSDRSLATVAGGRGNVASGDRSFVGGGDDNLSSGFASTTGGGTANAALGANSTVAGGDGNVAFAAESTVAGGLANEARGEKSAVGGGAANVASGFVSSIAGGISNSAPGDSAAISGGVLNCAGGSASWAGGTRAKVRRGSGGAVVGAGCQGVPATATPGGDFGTFIWADSQDADFISTGADQFMVRASGGAVIQRAIAGQVNARNPRALFNVVRGDSGIGQPSVPSDTVLANFESNGDGFLAVLGPAASNRGLLFGGPDNTADGGMVYAGATDTLQFLTTGTARLLLHSNGEVQLAVLGSAGSTTLCRNASSRIATCSSSARYKEAIDDLPPSLDRVLALRPVSYRWRDGGTADVGFVAEEVAALDERLITRNEQGEVEGVKYERLSALLAGAVQELDARAVLDAGRIAALEAENAALRAQVRTLHRSDQDQNERLRRLEGLLATGLATGER